MHPDWRIRSGVDFFNFAGTSLTSALRSVWATIVLFGEDRQNGRLWQWPRRQLGTLLVGYSFRLTKATNFNLSVGVGVTDEAQDVSITVRLPIMF